MNINSSKPPEGQGANRPAQPTQNVPKAANVESKDNAAAVKNASPKDRVDISSRSKEIADIMSAADQLPEVRDSKVREIKQRVDAGTYTVDPRKVAELILKSR